jgi:Phage integrase, N-terminal SAM-like domain
MRATEKVWDGRRRRFWRLPMAFRRSAPALIASADENAQRRFFEFFTANIRNRNTRRAYGLAVREFLLWCEQHGVRSIGAVGPVHVAGYIEQLTRDRSAPTAKQHLAATRNVRCFPPSAARRGNSRTSLCPRLTRTR